jgi:hypothetical protein
MKSDWVELLIVCIFSIAATIGFQEVKFIASERDLYKEMVIQCREVK